MARYTIGLVHNIAYFIEPMTEARGMTFHSLSIFCRGQVLSLYSTSHLAIQARTPSLTIYLELLQNLVKVFTH